ncbi:hypothetical protein RHGRI_012839 [Rhododendron griersonianum]|uniref:Transposase MuDR plant domain-containing protein n=1 Tax=Rhododendron griersonianum TaxID=479676 RepID=A0AAV6K3J0_9ERIC|nr:hypothetical protein RHGRI_012839 [Rhododendron griersonianum]
MDTPLYFDINVHFRGRMTEIKNIDPLAYSYIDLLEDVTERSLSVLPCNTGCTITLLFQVPGSNEKIVVGCDLDVLDMFRLCSRTCLIDLFVDVGDADGLGYTLPIGPQVDVNVNEFVHPQVDVEVNDSFHPETDFSIFNVHESAHEVVISDDTFDNDSFGVWADASEISSDGLSSYQSDDEGGRESSDHDDNDHGDSGSKSKGFDSSTFGHEFYVEKEGPIKFEVGMLFGDVNKFREVLKEYTIQQGCKIVRDKNERGRVTCHCAALGCEWRIHASPVPDDITYKIRSYKGEHTCLSSTTSVEANSTWIAKKFATTLRANPTMTLDAMQAELQQRFGIEASRIQLYRAKRKAMEEIEGNHGTSYAKLPTYAAEVRKSNPGSLVKIQCYRVTPQSPLFLKGYLLHLRP